MVTLRREVQFSKAPYSSVVIVLGKVTSTRELQSAKVHFLINVIPSGRTMLFKAEHPLKASYSIDFTLLGITTLTSPLAKIKRSFLDRSHLIRNNDIFQIGTTVECMGSY